MKMDERCHVCNGKYDVPVTYHMSFVNSETGDVDYAYVCPWCRLELKRTCEILTESRCS